MHTVELNIASLIDNPSALTRAQGIIVYNQIVDNLSVGNKVVLDFGEIESIITPFLNVSIGKLYENFSSEQLQAQLSLKNLPDGMTSKFQMVIQNAKNFYADKEAYTKTIEEVINNQ